MILLKHPDLSIVIPAYCEGKRVGITLDKLAEYLKRDSFFSNKTVEVVVVAADSRDRTKQIILKKQKLFKQLVMLEPGPKVGKGRDVQYGILRANGRKVLFMDADLATPLHHLSDFYKASEQGNNVVIGTRNLFKYRQSFFRRAISYVGNILFRLAGGLWIEDSQCGFKLFDEESAKLCFSKLSILGWRFDMEILAIAKSNGLRIKTYRINDWKDMPHSTYDESVIKTILDSVGDLIYIAARRISGGYTNKRDN